MKNLLPKPKLQKSPHIHSIRNSSSISVRLNLLCRNAELCSPFQCVLGDHFLIHALYTLSFQFWQGKYRDRFISNLHCYDRQRGVCMCCWASFRLENRCISNTLHSWRWNETCLFDSTIQKFCVVRCERGRHVSRIICVTVSGVNFFKSDALRVFFADAKLKQNV